MCGITGAIAFTIGGKNKLSLVNSATDCIASRGPDGHGVFTDSFIALGHRRLSIIDTSNAAAQPLTDASGRYTIIFNGEFFNYREHRQQLLQKGVLLKSESDTEVLLNLYIHEKEKCLDKVNGFFALAIYDKEEKTVFIARDRMGVKPLIYFANDDNFLFASEMKAMYALGIPKMIDDTSLFQYLQLNYIPQPYSIFKNVFKLKPGHYITLKAGEKNTVAEKKYYQIPFSENTQQISYTSAQDKLIELMEQSVKRRLVSDVPLGAFLSGGIDSSVIVAIAAKHVKNFHTYSIGYKDEPFFDETYYANLVAKMHGTNHTVFKLSNDELFENLDAILNYVDEPFADSSAIAVNILSKYTRKHVTVALSGDGADELFGGYNKHRAEWIIRNRPIANAGMKIASVLLTKNKGSRQSLFSNKVRQVHRFAEGAKLSPGERYYRWCAFVDEQDVEKLFYLKEKKDFFKRKQNITQAITGAKNLNDVLLTDMQLVLAGDMLTKVDSMSMANSLEVRNPFLDYELINFAFSLPSDYKIDKAHQKKIVKDAFRNILPPQLYTRRKKGFEVPLLKWFKTELKSKIENEWLEESFIREQNIFDVNEIRILKQQLFSNNPGEIHARIWGLIVFQNWFKRWFAV